MVLTWFTDSIVRLRAPLVNDAYGNPAWDWNNATSTPLTGWRVQPMQGARVTTAETIPREGLTRGRRLFGPYDADVLATDRIEWDSALWQIDGDIDRWRSPTGALAHTEIILTRMEG